MKTADSMTHPAEVSTNTALDKEQRHLLVRERCSSHCRLGHRAKRSEWAKEPRHYSFGKEGRNGGARGVGQHGSGHPSTEGLVTRVTHGYCHRKEGFFHA